MNKLTEVIINSFKKDEEIDSPFSFLKGEDSEIINIVHAILESSNLHYLLKERMILTALNTEEQHTKYYAWTQEWKEFPKELLEVLSEEQRQMAVIKNRDWHNPKLFRINVPNCKEWYQELYNWEERIKTGQKKVKTHLDWMFYVAQWHLKKYKKHKKLSSPEKIIAKKVELYKYYNEGIIVKKQRKSSNRYVASTGEQDNGETNKCQCILHGPNCETFLATTSRSSPITKITTTFDLLPGKQNDDSLVIISPEGQFSEKDEISSLSQEMGFENVKRTTYICSECGKKEVSALFGNSKGESSDTQPFVFINGETHIQDPLQDKKPAEEINQVKTKTIQNIDIVEDTLEIEVESSVQPKLGEKQMKLESSNQNYSHIEDYEKTKSGKNFYYNGINTEGIPGGSGQFLEAARLAGHHSFGNNATFNGNTQVSTNTPSHGNSLKGNGNQDNISINANTRSSTFSNENGSEIHLEKENPGKKSPKVAISEQIKSSTSQQTSIPPKRTLPPFPKPKKRPKICPSNNCPSIIMTKENDPDAYNIILLGESGVGKTTLFNSIANYLQCGSYEEAFEKPMFLSDISFYITVNSKPQLISVKRNISTDGNETSNLRDSYPFMQEVSFFNESSNSFKTLRILDTPGIHETNGGDSLENILHAAKQMKKIHGICILLRPDEARMKQQFRLILNSLLSNLDKDAIGNIFFVFTKVRAPGLMPGDSLSLITEYLKESKTNLTVDLSNVFRFDNGWFRNVCIGAHNKSSRTNYPVSPSNSWMYSKNEMNRLMNRLETLEPYQMEKSSFLSEIKQLLFDLAEPIGEAIFKKIKRKEEIKEKKEELVRERDVKLSQSQIKTFRRIHCFHCREKVNDKSSDKICFKTSKFDITTLDFANSSNCFKCNCFTSMHHQDKPGADEIYEDKITNLSMINNKINELSDEEKELEDDFNQIVKTCSNLLAFLNANTIVTGIDPLLDYFNILHQMEIDKEKCDHLYKSYYLEDIRSFRDHYNETSKSLRNPEPPNLEEIKKELANNKYYGECFKT